MDNTSSKNHLGTAILASFIVQPSNENLKGADTETFDVCCVGAGLSGAVLAERYASLLNKSVLVIDKRNHIGGNCYDYVDNETGILVNKYGAHLFHTNYKRVWEYVNLFSNWTAYEHRVQALIGKHHVPVPVNIDTVNTLFGLSIETPAEMRFWLEKEQLYSNTNGNYSLNPKNSEEMAVSRVGRRLYELIFHPYTIKQWDKEPKELGPEVTARIPVRDNYDDRYFSDMYQALPSKGYTELFKGILDNPLITTRTGVDYFDIRDSLSCEKTYFTGPIDAYYAHLGWDKLEYRSLDFERQVKLNEDYFLPVSVVNYPSANFDFTRIVEYKHYLKQKSNHTVFFFERSNNGGEPYYPVPNERNQALYKKYQTMAKQEKEVSFVGRLANYKYFNMDQSIKNALDLFDQDTGHVYNQQYIPQAPLPQRNWSKALESSFMPSPKRRVILYAKSLSEFSGGSEALVQLSLAFRTFLPQDFVLWYDGTSVGKRPALAHKQFHKEYLGVDTFDYIGEDSFRKGDILITPEIGGCSTNLTSKGVIVYRWIRVLDKITPRFRRLLTRTNGCQYFAQNFSPSEHPYQLQPDKRCKFPPLPPELVVRPYISPSLLTTSDDLIDIKKKENLVLFDDTNPQNVKTAIQAHCKELNCEAIEVTGLSRSELLALLDRAKIVISSTLVGMERIAIVSSLRGAVLITFPKLCGQDHRDFPIPSRNIVPEEGYALKETMIRVLENFEKELLDSMPIREFYRGINRTTMGWEAKSFYFSITARA